MVVRCTAPAKRRRRLRMVVSTLSRCAFLRALAYNMRWSVRCRRWKPMIRRKSLWCAVLWNQNIPELTSTESIYKVAFFLVVFHRLVEPLMRSPTHAWSTPTSTPMNNRHYDDADFEIPCELSRFTLCFPLIYTISQLDACTKSRTELAVGMWAYRTRSI